MSNEPQTMARRVHGRQVVTGVQHSSVVETRSVIMPDKSIVVARRRKDSEGNSYWTAEVPFEVALEIYAED